jgi:hypothetical protein
MVLTVDLAVFMGQSNMAGRGTAADSPRLRDGMGYEFRAVTAPDRLFALEEPFGKDENNPDGVFEPGMKTGSMVSAFVKACVEITETPIVGISCSKGGSEIAEWLPETAYYSDALHRVNMCKKWLTDNGYDIRHSFMVWCQGCTDGDRGTPTDVYKERTTTVLLDFLKDAGLEKCFLIQIGNHRDKPELYVRLQRAQEELVAENEDIVMVSRLFKTFAEKGLMKDEFHYLQEGYNLVGAEAGAKVGRFLERDLNK